MNKTIIICLWILFLCTNMLQAKIYNVKDFGAVGDGQHIDSEAINQAIVQAAREGGGTIYIPAGEYACYSIRLANQIHLYLEQGATVVAAFLRPNRDMTRQSLILITASRISDTATGKFPYLGN